jgi:hypothetical protein
MATASSVGPATFQHAVSGLRRAAVRNDVHLGPLPAPARLAPWSHAVSATVRPPGSAPGSDDEIASGRLILLHDPNGHDAWAGTFRIVVFATCELDAEIAADPLLPEVAWSWLTDALADADAAHHALGGTVTATASTRFGDIAGPQRVNDLEVRASWTPDGPTGAHLRAFAAMLATAAGLPPEGVTTIGRAAPSNAR